MDEIRQEGPDHEGVAPEFRSAMLLRFIGATIRRRREYARTLERLAVQRKELAADDARLSEIARANDHPPAIGYYGDVLLNEGCQWRLIEGRSAYNLTDPPADLADSATLSPVERSVLDRAEVRAQCGGPLRSYGQ